MTDKKLKFLRGARIIQALDEKTIPQLTQNIERGFPNTTKRQNATDPIQITQMKLVPSKPSTDLTVKTVAASEGKSYDPVIHFLDVTYQDEDNGNNITFTAVDGELYNISPVKLSESNVKVTCTCLDFYYRFAVWNDNSDSLYGKPPPPYKRKTRDRASVNPDKVSGICKHLIKTVESLISAGIVTR